MIDHANLVPAMNKKYGNLYVQDTIGKDVYKGMEADNKQATVMNLLVANQNMDEKTAYNIVKAVFEHRDELIRVHKEAENFKLENQKTAAAGGIPWHPGALRYYKEKGVKVD
jgi:TRAP transporter TAXI family solute receptor